MKRSTVRDLIADGVLRVEDGNHGNDRPRKHEFVPDGTAFIRAADMTGGFVEFGSAERIDEAARGRIRKGVGAPGDVILSHKGTVGRVAVAPMDSPAFVCSPQTTFWRTLRHDVINPTYLRYVLLSSDFQRQLAFLGGQSDMAPYVSLTDQRRMTLVYPDPEDQRAIAEVLGALDDKIEANRKLAATADALAGTHYSELVAGVEQEVRLGELLTLEYGKALPATQRRVGDVPVYGSGGVVGYHDEGLISGPGLIVGRKGSVGTVYWSEGESFPIDTVYYAKSCGSVPMTFLYFALQQQRFELRGTDSAVPGLNRNDAYRSTQRMPSEGALNQFDGLATQLFALGVDLRRQNDQIATLRDAMLPKLMSGKLRVREAEAAVAGAVLSGLSRYQLPLMATTRHSLNQGVFQFDRALPRPLPG